MDVRHVTTAIHVQSLNLSLLSLIGSVIVCVVFQMLEKEHIQFEQLGRSDWDVKIQLELHETTSVFGLRQIYKEKLHFMWFLTVQTVNNSIWIW